MMNRMTLGSLFDGSGGFPLAARNVGIKALWASEEESTQMTTAEWDFLQAALSWLMDEPEQELEE